MSSDDETAAQLISVNGPSSQEDYTVVSAFGKRQATVVSARFSLSVQGGPLVGASILVDAGRPSRLIVGQSTSCDFHLDDPEISRRHASFEVRGAYLQVLDLGSTNGTWVNGIRVNDALLAGGEIVRVGSTTIQVTVVEAQVTTPISVESRFGMVLGESEEMRRLYPVLEQLADNDAATILEGETGVGKELLAEAIHDKSRRSRGPFVVFDCTASPAGELEEVLFGSASRTGLFEEADGGTLFLDELGDLDMNLQSKLVRALDRGEFRRIGGHDWRSSDVRVISATRRDLDQALQANTFREDLYRLLAVARIELPPLRRRQGDISMLARHFWRRMKSDGSDVPIDVIAKLEAHNWPGNIRELHHTVARYVALGDLTPPTVRTTTADGKPAPNGLFDELLARDLPLAQARAELVEAFEAKYVERILAKHKGNVTHAAAASGLGRRYFQMLKARQRE